MGLQIDRLEKARTTGGGRILARCPACAESGGDTQGEHLVVYPNGSFGCCIYPGDKQHRRQIFALVGKKKSISVITVRKASRDQPARQWTSVSVTMTLPAPPTAANPDSELPVPSVPEKKSGNRLPPAGTLGTLISYSRAHTGREGITYAPYTEGRGVLPVPSVPEPSNSKDSETPVPSVPNQSPKPYIDNDGNLRIPFDSPERFHWWKGGQSIAETLNEIQSAGAFSTFTAAQVAVPNQPPQTSELATTIPSMTGPHGHLSAMPSIGLLPLPTSPTGIELSRAAGGVA